jgi:SAM-dependent methyltransferase
MKYFKNKISPEKKTSSTGKEPRIWKADYLVTHKTELWIKRDRNLYNSKTLLDLGCGDSPYKEFLVKCGCKKYIGLDKHPSINVDVVSNSWETGLDSSCIDIVFSTFSLEHTLKFIETVDEVYRVLKNNGIFMFSVPFCHNEHEQPDDYYRFTQYYLQNNYFLKGRFKVLSLEPSNGYVSSLFFLFMTLIKSIPSNTIGSIVSSPLIILLNSLGLVFDSIFTKIPNKKFVSLYASLPIAYFVILEKI